MKVCPIEGYKSAIAATIKARGIKVGTDPHICGLVSSFYSDKLVEPNLVPRGKLTVVLDAFTKLSFEPPDLASVELKFLTFKTVFLLSLASGPDEGRDML